MDKCGSTAIQAHFKLYRDWLLEHGIYYPLAGLGFGHSLLFEDLQGIYWNELVEEISSNAQGADCVFLSWEGVGFYRPEQISQLQDLLREYEVELLFYIRDQVDLVQSGYLQRLKKARQIYKLSDFAGNARLLTPPQRNFSETIGRFEAVFGAQAISLRLFDPSLFPDGNIVFDVLLALGLDSDARFITAANRQNTSLDVASALLLNIFDTVSDDSKGRALLVDELIWYVNKHGGNGMQFLDADSREHITEHYKYSNAAIKKRYNIDSPYDGLFAPRATEVKHQEGQDILERLAYQLRVSLWDGKVLEGTELEVLAGGLRGWSKSEPSGMWSVGDVSKLSFRLPSPRGYAPSRKFQLDFRGNYFADNRFTEIWNKEELRGTYDLRNMSLEVPLEWLEDQRELHLTLRHAAPQAPVGSPDTRVLAYQLASLAYKFC